MPTMRGPKGFYSESRGVFCGFQSRNVTLGDKSVNWMNHSEISEEQKSL